jgi:hypothetical protein
MKSGQAVTKFSLWLLSVFLLISCGNNQAVKTPGDTIKTGSYKVFVVVIIRISVDKLRQ